MKVYWEKKGDEKTGSPKIDYDGATYIQYVTSFSYGYRKTFRAHELNSAQSPLGYLILKFVGEGHKVLRPLKRLRGDYRSPCSLTSRVNWASFAIEVGSSLASKTDNRKGNS